MCVNPAYCDGGCSECAANRRPPPDAGVRAEANPDEKPLDVEAKAVSAPLAVHEDMDRWKRLPIWAQQELEQWRRDEAHQRGRAELAEADSSRQAARIAELEEAIRRAAVALGADSLAADCIAKNPEQLPIAAQQRSADLAAARRELEEAHAERVAFRRHWESAVDERDAAQARALSVEVLERVAKLLGDMGAPWARTEASDLRGAVGEALEKAREAETKT